MILQLLNNKNLFFFVNVLIIPLYEIILMFRHLCELEINPSMFGIKIPGVHSRRIMMYCVTLHYLYPFFVILNVFLIIS